MSRILAFLKGDGEDDKGRDRAHFWTLPDQELDQTRNFFQWVFPLQETVEKVTKPRLLSDSDIQAIKASLEARITINKASHWYCYFLSSNESWLSQTNRNHLRITRVIKSLRLLLSDAHAENYKSRVFELAGENLEKIGARARKSWIEA